jgi:alginate O-acetyltransferase complex protein AlgJ
MVKPEGDVDTRGLTHRSLPPVHEAWLPREHSLHRPRHGQHQRASLVCAIVFFCVPMLLLVIGIQPEAIENRRLVGFPSPGDGWGFFTSFEPWSIDHLPLRAQAIELEDAISRGIFGEAPKLGEQQDHSGPVGGPTLPGDANTDRAKVQAGYPKVIEGRDGWYYLGNDVAGPCVPDRPLAEVIAALQRLRSVVEASGRQFVLVVPPNKTTMVPENLPSDYVGKACASKAGQEFWWRLLHETGAIDLRPGLVAASADQPVYSKVDTHWTFDGALVMTRAIAEQVKPGVTTTWRASPGRPFARAGDIPPLIGRTGQLTGRTVNLAADGVTPSSKEVNSQLQQPLRLNRGPGTGVVDVKVAVLADSFTQPALPFFAAAFGNVTVVHVDTAQQDPRLAGQLLAEQDVVVLEAVERTLAGGTNPILSPAVIDRIGAELAARPRR